MKISEKTISVQEIRNAVVVEMELNYEVKLCGFLFAAGFDEKVWYMRYHDGGLVRIMDGGMSHAEDTLNALVGWDNDGAPAPFISGITDAEIDRLAAVAADTDEALAAEIEREREVNEALVAGAGEIDFGPAVPVVKYEGVVKVDLDGKEYNADLEKKEWMSEKVTSTTKNGIYYGLVPVSDLATRNRLNVLVGWKMEKAARVETTYNEKYDAVWYEECGYYKIRTDVLVFRAIKADEALSWEFCFPDTDEWDTLQGYNFSDDQEWILDEIIGRATRLEIPAHLEKTAIWEYSTGYLGIFKGVEVEAGKNKMVWAPVFIDDGNGRRDIELTKDDVGELNELVGWGDAPWYTAEPLKEHQVAGNGIDTSALNEYEMGALTRVEPGPHGSVRLIFAMVFPKIQPNPLEVWVNRSTKGEWMEPVIVKSWDGLTADIVKWDDAFGRKVDAEDVLELRSAAIKGWTEYLTREMAEMNLTTPRYHWLTGEVELPF